MSILEKIRVGCQMAAAENFGRVRRIASNLMRGETSKKRNHEQRAECRAEPLTAEIALRIDVRRDLTALPNRLYEPRHCVGY